VTVYVRHPYAFTQTALAVEPDDWQECEHRKKLVEHLRAIEQHALREPIVEIRIRQRRIANDWSEIYEWSSELGTGDRPSEPESSIFP
jgi:hypothetical protein